VLSTIPNTVGTQYPYDDGSRLTELIYQNAAGSLGNLTYQYDVAGNHVRELSSEVVDEGERRRTLLGDLEP
jgi:hypothetical protein